MTTSHRARFRAFPLRETALTMRRMRKGTTWALLCTVAGTVTSPALGQQGAPPPADTDTALAPRSAAEAPGEVSASRDAGAAIGVPVRSESTDPLLVPPPAPVDVLRSWPQALAMVRSQATSINRSAARIRLARAQADQALAGVMPTLAGSANVNRHLLYGTGPIPPYDSFPLDQGPIPDPGTTWQAGLELRIPLFAPQAWHELQTARDAVDTATLGAREAERQILAGLADSIVGVVTAERLSEVSRVALDSSLATLELTRRRARFGAATALDVLRAEQEVTRSRTQVVATNENVRQARESLGMVLGTPRPWGVTPAIQVDALAGDIAALCQVEPAVGQRSDVRYARSQRDLVQRSIETIDRGYWPTVDASSTMAYWSRDTSTPNRQQVTWTIGAVLNWRIIDGGLRHAQHRAQTAQVSLATQDLIDTERQAALEIEQSTRAIEVAQANLQQAARASELSAETLRLARIAFVNGTGTSFELVEAQQQQRQAEIDLAVREFQLIRARLAALLAMANCDV